MSIDVQIAIVDEEIGMHMESLFKLRRQRHQLLMARELAEQADLIGRGPLDELDQHCDSAVALAEQIVDEDAALGPCGGMPLHYDARERRMLNHLKQDVINIRRAEDETQPGFDSME